ncbi:MAG: hypothetical protein KKC50_08165 [Candidatus Omnitrophica bacterium]|nr:hypothetical protein [Candidatus Omnitrophota bacterium]MBU1657421.1 hypothetical protein [Candidatus Omnitrophota bacterium]
MDKIATPRELRSEIRRLLAYSQTERPSREKLAAELRGLAGRVAADRVLRVRYINGYWRADLVKDRTLLNQFARDAGVIDAPYGKDKDDIYEKLLEAAGKHGYSLEVVGP